MGKITLIVEFLNIVGAVWLVLLQHLYLNVCMENTSQLKCMESIRLLAKLNGRNTLVTMPYAPPLGT